MTNDARGKKVYLVHGNADVFSFESDARRHALKWISDHFDLIPSGKDKEILLILLNGDNYDLIEHFYNQICPEGQGVYVAEQEVR